MKKIQIIIFVFIGMLALVGCEKTDDILVNVDDSDLSTGSLQGEVQAIDSVMFHIQLLNNGQLIDETRTNSSYEFNKIEAGEWTVHISAEGYQAITHTVTVVAGETVTLTKVHLEPSMPPGRLEPGEGLEIGTQAPEFELPDGNSELHSLSEHLESGKNVVLIFYRTGG